MTRHKQGRKSMTGPSRTRKSSFMASPHGAALTYSRHDSFGGGSQDLERMLLRRVDRVSKVEVPVDMDDAIGETGHGRFQKCLWVICGLIYACCSISTTTLSFVLPAACDFHLTAGEKGLMNIMPVAGMMIGSYFWGFFADSKGRRFVLVCSLMIDGLAGMFSSLCQEKKMFLAIRVFNGFGIIGSVSVVFAYLGEFLTDSKRDKALASLELWWTFGIVSEPVIGYLVIPRRYVLGEPGVFIYDSWRLYVFLCGLPSVIMGLIMIKMPESPRFLLLQGKLIKARNVLQFMFNFNHGKHSSKEYPVKVLQPSAQTEFYFFKSMHDISTWVIMKEMSSGIWKLHVFLFQNCLKNIILTSYIDFGLMFSYNTLINWIPELLNNVNHFESVHGEGYTLCDVQEYKNTSNASSHSFQHTAFFGTFINPVLSDVNHRHMQHHWGFYRAAIDPSCHGVSLSVYLETFFVCLCCLPTTIATYYCIQHISKKIILVTELLVAGVVTILVTMVKKGEHVFFLMCMFEAFTTVVEAVLFCIVVEIFPDQVRGIALCLTVTIGRFGAVVGNFIFGALITTNCRLPFSFFSFLFFTGCIAVVCFPKLKLGH